VTFSELANRRRQLSGMVKEAGVLGLATKAVTAPVRMAGRGLWNASKRTGGPFAPLLFGGAILGGAAAAKKAIGQAHSYNQGFNPQVQEAMTRGM
jgi:hypothetical protein